MLGAGLRWYQIGQHSFWFDEALSSLIANLTTSEIIANVAASDHPPGYYLLLHAWLTVGQSETAIRSLSALFSLATIPLLYGLTRWLFNSGAASLVGLIAAISPFQIYYAQESRTYSIVIFLTTALIWIFMVNVKRSNSWLTWGGYVLIVVLALHFHYFIAFVVISLHLWLLLSSVNVIKLRIFQTCNHLSKGVGFDRLNQRTNLMTVVKNSGRLPARQLLLADMLIALLFIPQSSQAISRTTAYLTTVSWQSSPHLLSPLITLYYLLFVHRTPWPQLMVSIGLFLLLLILALILWEGHRRYDESQKQSERALWLILVVPMAIVMLISWLIRPIYLDRSFAIASPALMTLLAWGTVAAPRRSPTPYFMVGLMLTMLITLSAHYLTPDPAKPPLREAAHIIATEFAPNDVSLHLQNASYIPALWYTPDIPHQQIDVSGAFFTSPEAQYALGGQVVEWQTALIDADRLWLTVMLGYMDDEQKAIKQEIESTYSLIRVIEFEQTKLYLYDLKE
ncbi:glycosyltransferase family 39 protein [Anaerolineales bacterium HSG24]|nr:glycosyltransferase family 39 protein [Anaerolineales bacterium HSG24]